MGFLFSTGSGGGGGGGTTITTVANYSALPAANTVAGQFYFCENSQGTWWLPGSLGGTFYNAGLYYSNGVTWETVDVPFQATQLEVNAETVTDKFVAPTTLGGWFTQKVIGALTLLNSPITASDTVNTAFGKLQAQITGNNSTWLNPAISILNTPPVSPTTGDRYLIDTAPTGVWVGNANSVAEWNGTTYDYTVPVNGNAIIITSLSPPNNQYQFNAGVWSVTTISNAILQNGNSFGSAVRIGSIDNQEVRFLQNNTLRGTILVGGILSWIGNILAPNLPNGEVSTVNIQNEATTESTTFVSPRRFWNGITRFLAMANTWSATQTINYLVASASTSTKASIRWVSGVTVTTGLQIGDSWLETINNRLRIRRTTTDDFIFNNANPTLSGSGIGALNVDSSGNFQRIATASMVSGPATLVAGVATVTVAGCTSASRAIVTLAVIGGSGATVKYRAVCTTNTLTITALDTSNATVTTDTSTLNYLIEII